MNSVYLFRMLQVRPEVGSELSREHPAAKGAYVDCAVFAASRDAAQLALTSALERDRYILEQLGDVYDLGLEGAWNYHDLPNVYIQMGRDAMDEAEVIYGEFYCW